MKKTIIFFLLVRFLLNSPAFADINNALANGLSSCMKVSSDEERLVCFDKLLSIDCDNIDYLYSK